MLTKFRYVLFIVLVNACLVGSLSFELFGKDLESTRIGVCNIANESKPIEIESDSPDRSIAYPNLSEAFYSINQGIHTGQINVEVCFDSFEREAAILRSNETEKANYSKVIIRPLKDNLMISAKTGYNALIALNGADNVTIDGDNPNTAGINRNLTIRGWGGRSIIAIQTRVHSRNIYDSARSNTLKNLNIYGRATPSFGIALGGHNPGSSGHLNNNNSVINCAFRRVRTGIFSGGKSPQLANQQTKIINNDLSTIGDDRVRLVGIHLEYESNAVVTDNKIGGLKSHDREIQDEVGIRLGGGKISALARKCTDRCYRSVTKSNIARNIINGIIGGDRQSVAGIYIYGYDYAQNTIKNNVVTGVIGSSLKPKITAGIFVAGKNGSRTFLLNNSVSMTGEYGSEKIHNPSYAVVLWGTDIFVSMFNNIFSNTQSATKNPWAKSFAGGFVIRRSKSEELQYGLLKSNNNIFYSNGKNKGFIGIDSLQRREVSEINNLNDWQKISSNDSDSMFADPLFVNPENNLNLRANSPAINSGADLDKLFDIQIKSKSAATKSKNDIGAFEWKP